MQPDHQPHSTQLEHHRAHDGQGTDQHRTYRFGEGSAEVGSDGTVTAIRHPAHPHLNVLLDPTTTDWFGSGCRWGTGFVISSAGSGRFGHPKAASFEPDRVLLRYEPVRGLHLSVTRDFSAGWQERYLLTNRSDTPVTIGSYAIQVPIADAYGPAATVLSGRCHAHVWPGGAESWLVAIRMDGEPPVFALDLTEGELWSYSISGRSQRTSSNVRGVIALHATDHARAPHAFGGQPELRLEPGAALTLGWRLGWHDDIGSALAGRSATVAVPTLAAPVGTPIEVGGRAVRSDRHGVSHVDVPHADGRRSRVAVLHHTPIEELVARRVAAVLDRHRPLDRPGHRADAFVPYDTEHGLALSDDLGWTDWSDGRERVGMPLLLLGARARGWCPPDRTDQVDTALVAYRDFCRAHLITPDCRVTDGSDAPNAHRLYNRPWFAWLFAELHAAFGYADDLDLAVSIVDGYYADGGAGFLAIGAAEAVYRVAERCEADPGPGRRAIAARLRAHLVAHGLELAALGADLPAHEVMYEQSMTAPLLSILLGARRLADTERQRRQLEEAIDPAGRWLLAFAGRQPHVRLRNVPIRHWDGYWFGRLRLYGDTFPHYWSMLSPRALLDWPDDLPDPTAGRIQQIVRDVTAANLVDFTPDGNASCAFLMPSAIDGRPGYVADPLANDQDMGLAIALLPGIAGRAPIDVLCPPPTPA